jgi:hypothetical protein
MKEQFGLNYQMHNEGTIEGTGRTTVPIASFVEVFERFHLLDPESFPDIDAFLSLKVETRLSIQSKLTQYLIDSRHKQFNTSRLLVHEFRTQRCWESAQTQCVHLQQLTIPNPGDFFFLAHRLGVINYNFPHNRACIPYTNAIAYLHSQIAYR